MKIKSWNYADGKFTLNLIDNNQKPLGFFIATDPLLIKQLQKNNLHLFELIFEEHKRVKN